MPPSIWPAGASARPTFSSPASASQTPQLDNLGRILKGKITINLTEYAEEASSKKASSGKSGNSGKSGSSSKSAAGIATYKRASA